jgi:DNA replication protein DnaC
LSAIFRSSKSFCIRASWIATMPLDAQARHDLLESLEERYGRRSTIITGRLPVEDWHAVIGEPRASWCLLF